MKTKLLLTATLVAWTIIARSEGGDSGNGGNKDGLAFTAAALRGIKNLPSDVASDELKEKILETLKSAKVIVVSEKLYVKDENGKTQESTATNFSKTKTIYVNGPGFNSLMREEERQPFAVHEVLCLMGLEKTGDYHISAALRNTQIAAGFSATTEQVAKMNLKSIEEYQRKLFAQMSSNDSSRAPFEILKELYETAPQTAKSSDFASCDLTKSTPCPVAAFFRTLLVKGHNYDLVPVKESTTIEDVRKAANYDVRFGHFTSRAEIEPMKPAVAPIPGAGPLFPGKNGSDEIPAKYEKRSSLTFNDCSVSENRCKYQDAPANTSITQTKTDLIERLYDREGVIKITLYLRLSGNLLAIKFVRTNGNGSESTEYSYGWKSEK